MKVIITGATGMVGEGVLHECLQSNEITDVLIINRKPYDLSHPKLKEIVHSDFHDISPITAQLKGYDACFFCLGVSVVGLNEEQYHRITYDLTIHVAETLVAQNPGMVFCYVSGASTDSTEKGKTMWARIKGKTENQLLRMSFRRAYMFRPGFMRPTPGLKNTLKLYKIIGWLYPVLKLLFPNSGCTLKEVGYAMINSVSKGYDRQVLEVKDIVALAHK